MFCTVLIIALLNVCRVYPAALAPVWPVCWLWFTVKCSCWVLRRRLFSQVIFHCEPQTRALSQHTGIIRDDSVRLQRRWLLCRAGIRISLYIPQREKCFLDMLNLSSFQRGDAPHPSNGAHSGCSSVCRPAQDSALCLPSCYLIYF